MSFYCCCCHSPRLFFFYALVVCFFWIYFYSNNVHVLSCHGICIISYVIILFRSWQCDSRREKTKPIIEIVTRHWSFVLVRESVWLKDRQWARGRRVRWTSTADQLNYICQTHRLTKGRLKAGTDSRSIIWSGGQLIGWLVRLVIFQLDNIGPFVLLPGNKKENIQGRCCVWVCFCVWACAYRGKCQLIRK